MKKVIWIYFLVVMTMLFAGCKLGSVFDNQTNIPVESTSNDVTDYKLNIEEYIAYNENNKQFKVKYAQISSLGNEGLENKINQTLRSSITEWINKDCEWVEKFQVDVKYKTSQYLSLCYTIEWKNPQSEDFMSTFTRICVTIDMQTGERVYLDDLVKDITSLKQKLENYSYGNEFSPPIDSKEAEKIIHFASISENKYLEEIYKTTDPYVYDNMLSYITLKPSFYMTEDKLVITRNEYDLNDVFIDFNK